MIKRVTVKLKQPLTDTANENRKIKELEISDLKAKHLRLLPKSALQEGAIKNPADFLPLIASVCNISEELADELAFHDLLKVVDVLVRKMGK